jgi:LPXTG-motif cell wall-anchored protein
VVTITVGGQVTSLPRTGSSDTGRFVVVGLALVAVGLVLVSSARRRRAVTNRA